MEIVERHQVGFQVLPKRWIVERTLAWLGINRPMAKDFERFANTGLAFIQTAMIKLMTRRLARYPLSEMDSQSRRYSWTGSSFGDFEFVALLRLSRRYRPR